MTSLVVWIVIAIDLVAISMTKTTDSGETYKLIQEKGIRLTEKFAKSFLKPSRRVRRGDDPISECSEATGCSWEEVREHYGNNPSTIKEFMTEFKCGTDCQYDSFTYCEITSTSFKEMNGIQYRCSRDGGWGAWSSFGACSVTCGTGNRTRSRICDSPAQMGGGDNCLGDISEKTPCVLKPCAVDGMWGSWGPWGVCSVTCETGVKLRNRTCDNPAPNYGGVNCRGSSRDSTSCSLPACPVDGGWESWKAWSGCALVSGNVRRTRCRTCTNPAPAHGGNHCPDRRRQSENCNIPKSAVRRPCRCPISQVAEIKNISAEELIVLVKEIKEELSVDVSKLSKTIAKKVSAKDSRVSTKTLGVVGAVILILPIIVIIGLDCVSLRRFFGKLRNKVHVTTVTRERESSTD